MRHASLDALRGIAALIVLFHHCALSFPRDDAAWSLGAVLRAPPFSLLVDGPGAVFLFFALSGFALSASLDATTGASVRPFQYWRYALGRMLRLYPPYAVAVLASAVLYLAIQPHAIAGLSAWFNRDSWAFPVTWRLVGGELLMLDEHQYMSLLNPGWALIHILRLSLVFPLVFFALRWRPGISLALCAAFSVIANFAQTQPETPLFLKAICASGQYLISFALGGALYLARNSILRGFERWGLFALIAAFASSLVCFLLPRQLPGANIWFPTAGAVLLMSAILSSDVAKRALDAASLQWLGKISFSLYLTHIVVLLTTFHLFWGQAPAFVLVGAIIAGSLGAAVLLHVGIEKPFAAFGSRLRSRTALKVDQHQGI